MTGEEMSQERLTHHDFAPHVGTDFTVPAEDDSVLIHFVLTDVKALSRKPGSGDFRDPFQLTFRVATQDVFPQGLYPLTHPVLGQYDIFLVPAAKSDAGVDYCATFN
ncbi:DUF6916 family protein [Sphingomonas asaccharolytica]|uniref:DUF6916 family protein n=1 Tax=Sphingomonas asaccharolytica TaxID=40681 RepID=UPI00082E22FC|nr:hypothetical protein [Sphingomonas asaccharolytica]